MRLTRRSVSYWLNALSTVVFATTRDTPLVPLGGYPIPLFSFLRFLVLYLPTQASKFFIHHFYVRLLRFVGEVTQKSKALPYSPSWDTPNPFA